EVRRMGWERPAELVRGVYEELSGVHT
ncbi:MAG: hypothetical protein RL112_399, partial [Planctomycetota bacterium]